MTEPIIPRTSGNGVLLELLVEFFHASVLKGDTKITRRKRYRRNGRVIAEVDVVLEGDGQRLAIECRDRNKQQGLPWIQQIIGKRELLRGCGITRWFALSASGFTEDAIELAGTTGIIPLVPGRVEPDNPNAPGVHRFMKYNVRLAYWDFAQPLAATIGHDDDATLDRVEEQLAAQSWSSAEIGTTPDDLRPFAQFVDQAAQPLIDAEEKASGSAEYYKTVRVALRDLHGAVCGITFQIAYLELHLALTGTTIKPEFRMLTFSNPVSRRVLGIIGLNTFTHNGKRLHMMVHAKLGRPGALTMSVKDDAGRPAPGVTICVPASFVTPPDTAGPMP